MAKALQDRQLVIDGVTYNLRISIRFFLALQERWDLPDEQAVRAAIPDRAKNLRGMVDVVWAALQTHHRELGWDDVLSLLDSADMEEVAAGLGDAMEAATPPPTKRPGAGQGTKPTP